MSLPVWAQIEQRPDGLYATVFGDYYSSRQGALAQAQAVFLAGCGLPEAWRDPRDFCVGELGFGAGINFLATCRIWRETAHQAPRPPILHYWASEAFPLRVADAAFAHASCPELAPLAEALQRSWPARAGGIQRIWFEAWNVVLTLVMAPSAQAIDHFPSQIKAWYLDGFAPSKNGEHWHKDLLAKIAAHSAPAARLATYSVAGQLRRDLVECGFTVARAPGFGQKSARLEAVLGPPQAPDRTKPIRPNPQAPNLQARILVIGGGIGGASAALALRRRGIDVTLIDTGDGTAASLNPMALVHPRFDARDHPARRLYVAAFLFARANYLASGSDAFALCPVEQLPRHADEPARFAKMAADPPLGPEWLDITTERIVHHQAGFVRPGKLIPRWLQGCTVLRGRLVAGLAFENGQWIARDAAGADIAHGDGVIWAPGAHSGSWSQDLPVDRIQGQMEWGQMERELTNRGSDESEPMETPGARSGESYLIQTDAELAFGASFDRLPRQEPFDPANFAASGDRRAENLAALRKLAPQLVPSLPKVLHSRQAVRAAFPDQMPVLGALAEGLILIAGLGSRGFTLGPLLGEAAAAMLLGEPQPLEASIVAALEPQRFARRKLNREAGEPKRHAFGAAAPPPPRS